MLWRTTNLLFLRPTLSRMPLFGRERLDRQRLWATGCFGKRQRCLNTCTFAEAYRLTTARLERSCCKGSFSRIKIDRTRQLEFVGSMRLDLDHGHVYSPSHSCIPALIKALAQQNGQSKSQSVGTANGNVSTAVTLPGKAEGPNQSFRQWDPLSSPCDAQRP